MRRVFLPVLLLILLAACSSSTPSPTPVSATSFTIRRLATERSVDDLVTAEPAEFTCTDEALITLADLVHYDWESHTMTLTPEAAARLTALDLVGTPFVVCVEETPVYVGVFWSSLFSLSYDGLVIDLLLLDSEPKLHLATGYPESPEMFRGQDRRSDVRIWQALYAAGKVP